ncbi:LPXTG cell wall anchor domain-containing protein [Fructobacillus fructosus]|uniref:LPXTG cell wall anchor domain-containing protein n=1 Tax=Fructobacillus fructosus TaxID=1631 RepID=UPI001658A5CA|nr:LPXTG cell wall anchor domain-containing protein [Fructobacillus fructosus]MBC9119293.1 LPXTG cell wall anchor domain-containing protein [Fructobacillus fructosus]MBD9366951.1 LPXTG cell wall anchor domain-containing protein [Leuconostoc mesenteroides]
MPTQTMNVKEHFKMYKSGKRWLYASLAAATLLSGGVALSQSVSADEAAPTTTTQNQEQAQTTTSSTQKNADTTTTNAQTTTDNHGEMNKVNGLKENHDKLNQAAATAQVAGVTVTDQGTTTKTVTQDQVSNERQAVKNDETAQTAQVNQATANINSLKDSNKKVNDAATDAQNSGVILTQDNTVKKDPQDAAQDAQSQADNLKKLADEKKADNDYVAQVLKGITNYNNQPSEDKGGLKFVNTGQKPTAIVSSDYGDKNTPFSQIQVPNSVSVDVQQGSQAGTNASLHPFLGKTNAIDPNVPFFTTNSGDTYRVNGLSVTSTDGGPSQNAYLIYKVNSVQSIKPNKGSYVAFHESQNTGNGQDRGAHSLSIFITNASYADIDAKLYAENGQPLNIKTAITYNDIDIEQGIRENSGNIVNLTYSDDTKVADDGTVYSTSSHDLNGNETDEGQYIAIGQGNDFSHKFYNPYTNQIDPDTGKWGVSTDGYDTFRYDLFGTDDRLKTVSPKVITGNYHLYDQTQAVTVHKTDLQYQPVVQPHKSETNEEDENNNTKPVMRGDIVKYYVNQDYTGYKDADLTESSIGTTPGAYDNYDAKTTANPGTEKTYLMPEGYKFNPDTVAQDLKKGQLLDNNEFVYQYDNQSHKFTVNAKDAQDFLTKYIQAGRTLVTTFNTTVNDDVDGQIQNTAYQLDFQSKTGRSFQTETVQNPLPKINPKKDVVAGVGDRSSLNNQTIDYGQLFDYALESSTRPANYGGKTNEWSIDDQTDTAHDLLTGQYSVLNSGGDLTTENGQKIVKNQIMDPSYFTAVMDGHGKISLQATDKYLKLIDLPDNKKVPVQWMAYVQTKRIAYGDAKNVFTESFNHQSKKSNEVLTHTPHPEVKNPITNNYYSYTTNNTTNNYPQQPIQRQLAVTPAPTEVDQLAKPALPETGKESANDHGVELVSLAAIGSSLAFALSKQKKSA